MKATVTKEVHLCDNCQTEAYPYACLKCGVEYCWQCAEKFGVQYRHDVWAQGAGDGFYCRPCDIELSESKADPVHQAYVAIRQLRDEQEAFGNSLERRRELAKKQLAIARSKATSVNV